ncbi:MAG: DinB family protein [Dehalococcoidia bacterium]
MATEVADDRRAQVRSYIQHNATKSAGDMLDMIQEEHERLLSLVAGLSDEQATFKPAADEWSVLDTLTHVVAGKKGVARLAAALAKGEKPPAVGGEGETQKQDGVKGRDYASLADVIAAINAAHDELTAFLRQVSDESNSELTHPHFIFGDLNCREWAVFQRVHDRDHGGQIASVIAAPGFPA